MKNELDFNSWDEEEEQKDNNPYIKNVYIDDIINKTIVDKQSVLVHYIDMVINEMSRVNPELELSTSSILEPQFFSKNIIIDNEWESDDIVKEKIINDYIDISNSIIDDREKIFYHNKKEDFDELIKKIKLCSDLISVKCRMGPANSILIPEEYDNKFNKEIIENLNIRNCFIYNGKDIIMYRKQNKIYSQGVFLFVNKENNEYKISRIGNVENLFKKIKIVDED